MTALLVTCLETDKSVLVDHEGDCLGAMEALESPWPWDIEVKELSTLGEVIRVGSMEWDTDRDDDIDVYGVDWSRPSILSEHHRYNRRGPDSPCPIGTDPDEFLDEHLYRWAGS